MDSVWTLFTELVTIYQEAAGGDPDQWTLTLEGPNGRGYVEYAGEVYSAWDNLAEAEIRLVTLRDSYRAFGKRPEK